MTQRAESKRTFLPCVANRKHFQQIYYRMLMNYQEAFHLNYPLRMWAQLGAYITFFVIFYIWTERKREMSAKKKNMMNVEWQNIGVIIIWLLFIFIWGEPKLLQHRILYFKNFSHFPTIISIFHIYGFCLCVFSIIFFSIIFHTNILVYLWWILLFAFRDLYANCIYIYINVWDESDRKR